MGSDFDLDDARYTGAVRHVGLPATGAEARIDRRVAHILPLLERGPQGAAVSGGAGLPAAPAF